jgi:hypothetical protein
MRKMIGTAAIALVGLGVVGAPVAAMALTSNGTIVVSGGGTTTTTSGHHPTTTTTTAPPTKWMAVVATFATLAQAQQQIAGLAASGFPGFSAIKVNGGYEVEKTFATKAAAQAEVNKLLADNRSGVVEPAP